MSEMDEEYDLLRNNCQHFVVRLADKVLRDGRKKFKSLNGDYISMRERGTERSSDEQKFLAALKEDVIIVGDRDDDGAIIENKESHKEILDTVVAVLVNNTPSYKEKNH